MKWIVLCLLFASCTANELVDTHVVVCPTCSNQYQEYTYCAFYDTDWPKQTHIIDNDQYEGVGIPVSVRGYMHHKFCFNQTHATFGSANPTVNGLQKNSNLIVTMNSSILAKNFYTEYQYLLGNHSGKHTKKWKINNRPITQLFCPRDNCEQHIIQELKKAQESIIFLSFSFTSQAIAQELIAKHNQDVCIQGVVENRASSASYAQTPTLQASNISVFRVHTPGVMHHKAFLIDNSTAIIGSYNPSQNANTNNAESIIILQEEAVIYALQEEFTRLSGFAACKRF